MLSPDHDTDMIADHDTTIIAEASCLGVLHLNGTL